MRLLGCCELSSLACIKRLENSFSVTSGERFLAQGMQRNYFSPEIGQVSYAEQCEIMALTPAVLEMALNFVFQSLSVFFKLSLHIFRNVRVRLR